MFSQNTQSWQQSATIGLHLSHLKSSKLSRNIPLALVNFTFIAGSQTCFGLDTLSRSTVLRPDVDCCFLSEGRLPDVPEERSMPVAHAGMQIPWETEKTLCSASAPDKLTWSWPHYCRNTLGRGCHCLISKSTKIVWDFYGFLGGVGVVVNSKGSTWDLY